MKTLISFLFALVLSAVALGQTTYNPSLGTTSNKSYAPAQAVPTDSRTYFYDATNGVYRPYVNTAEVISYLNLAKYRTGQFDIVVNTGGSLSVGVITGGTNDIWYFKNGTNNSDLVLKNKVASVNGQTGVVIAKSADTLKGIPIDTTIARNGYLLTFDSTLRKWYLSPGAETNPYTQGSGIDITNHVVSALNANPLWNANQIRSRSISTASPDVGNVIKWDGIQFSFKPDNTALDTAYYSNDTLYLIGTGDTAKVVLQLVPVGDNWGNQTASHDGTLTGNAADIPLGVDTINDVATKHDRDSLQYQINHLSSGGGGKTKLQAYSIYGDSLYRKVNDSLYTIMRIRAGTNITLINSGDTALTINGSSGSAEINAVAGTYSTTDSLLIPAGSFVGTILVKPTANLTAFKVGTATNATEFITSTPVQADVSYQILMPAIYLPIATKIYVSGITSSTQLKILYKPIHE